MDSVAYRVHPGTAPDTAVVGIVDWACVVVAADIAKIAAVAPGIAMSFVLAPDTALAASVVAALDTAFATSVAEGLDIDLAAFVVALVCLAWLWL